MTARETVEQKARRYLAEGRIVVTRVLGDTVDAVCQGQEGSYELGYRPGRGWFCSCPVRTDDCCHLRALWLITIRRRAPAPKAPVHAQPDPRTRLDPAA
jgi:hypothetical protein